MSVVSRGFGNRIVGIADCDSVNVPRDLYPSTDFSRTEQKTRNTRNGTRCLSNATRFFRTTHNEMEDEGKFLTTSVQNFPRHVSVSEILLQLSAFNCKRSNLRFVDSRRFIVWDLIRAAIRARAVPRSFVQRWILHFAMCNIRSYGGRGGEGGILNLASAWAHRISLYDEFRKARRAENISRFFFLSILLRERTRQFQSIF